MPRPRSEIKRAARALRPVLPFTWEAPDVLGESGRCILRNNPVTGLGRIARIAGIVTDRSRYLEFFNLITESLVGEDEVEFKHYRFLDGGIILSIGQTTFDAAQMPSDRGGEIKALLQHGNEMLTQRRDPVERDYLHLAHLLDAGIAYYNKAPHNES